MPDFVIVNYSVMTAANQEEAVTRFNKSTATDIKTVITEAINTETFVGEADEVSSFAVQYCSIKPDFKRLVEEAKNPLPSPYKACAARNHYLFVSYSIVAAANEDDASSIGLDQVFSFIPTDPVSGEPLSTHITADIIDVSSYVGLEDDTDRTVKLIKELAGVDTDYGAILEISMEAKGLIEPFKPSEEPTKPLA